MRYLFKIRLCGRICEDCSEPLKQVTVTLYQNTANNQANLAAANPKATFSPLTDQQVSQKSSLLLAKGVTDELGRLDLELEQNYNGGAFDVDIQVAGADDGQSYHFHLTTLAPSWIRQENGLVSAWDYCLPIRQWCRIRALLGRWIICGRVVHCKTGAPIGGVKVSAFDRDWLQDDPLGSALTGGDGRFHIEYSRADFEPGTFIDVELFGGPDLYFHIHHPSGAPLLLEPPDKGRGPGREDVGHCFCVSLCIDEEIEEEVYPPPVFTHVGGYNHQTQINSAPGATGLTSADGRAFYASIRLNGTLPKKFAGGPMEYRFDVRELQPNGTPITAWTPVNMAQISRTVIGELLHYAPISPTDPNPIKSQPYTVNGNPGEAEAAVVAGWIRVPQESNVFGPSGFFQPHGNQIRLNTQTLGGWSDIDLTGLTTGVDTTSTGMPLAQNRYFALRMRVRRVGFPATEQIAGVCQQIAINNTRYDNILRHPAWMPQNLSNQLGVCMVDIQQLIVGGGCVGIGADLDVLFSAAHPTLGNVSISMSGPGGPYSFTLPAAFPGQQFGTATPNFVVANLSPCAYIVTLSVQVLLTTGDSIPDNLFDQIAFCKV